MTDPIIKAKCEMYIGSILMYPEQFGHDKINIMKAGDMAHADTFLADVLAVVRKQHVKNGKTKLFGLVDEWNAEHGNDEEHSFRVAIANCIGSSVKPEFAQSLEEDIRACVA